jgi:hypothetical protein
MDINGDLIASMIVTVAAIAGLLWRFETRISGVETRLGERIARIEGRLDSFATKADVSRIEGRLDSFATKADVARIEGYFMQNSKKEE